MTNVEDCTLWCGNLHEDVTEELLHELFIQVGPLENVKIPYKDGRKVNYAFIKFLHDCSVLYAMRLLNGIRLFGSSLKLQSRNTSVTNYMKRNYSSPSLNNLSHGQQTFLSPNGMEPQNNRSRLNLPPPRSSSSPQLQIPEPPRENYFSRSRDSSRENYKQNTYTPHRGSNNRYEEPRRYDSGDSHRPQQNRSYDQSPIRNESQNKFDGKYSEMPYYSPEARDIDSTRQRVLNQQNKRFEFNRANKQTKW